MNANGYTRHPGCEQWPPLSEAEFDALQQSVVRHGCSTPIVVLPDGRIIDGWHRWQACQAAGIEALFVERDLSDDEVARWIVDHHKGRRHLSAQALAESVVRTFRACGYEWAERGRPSTENDRQITRDRVTGSTGVSEGTARRAITTVQGEERPPPPPGTPQDNAGSGGGERTPSTGSAAQAGPGTPPAPPPEDPAAAEHADRNMLEEMRRDLAYLREENEDLARQIGIATKAANPENKDALQEAKRLRMLVLAQKSQIAQWQQKANTAQGTVKALKRRVQELEAKVRAYEEQP